MKLILCCKSEPMQICNKVLQTISATDTETHLHRIFFLTQRNSFILSGHREDFCCLRFITVSLGGHIRRLCDLCKFPKHSKINNLLILK